MLGQRGASKDACYSWLVAREIPAGHLRHRLGRQAVAVADADADVAAGG